MRTAGWIVALAAFGVAGGALVLHFVATPWKPAIVLASLAHYAMWAAPVGLLIALGLQRWWTSAAGALLTVAVLVLQLPPLVADTQPGRHRLVVLQTNLKVGAADPAALVRIVREQRVDVLATEELTSVEEHRLLAAGLADALPHRYTKPLAQGGGGLGLWSRYPLTEQQDVPGFWLGVLSARVELPDETATVLAVHVTPPYPYDPARWRDELARLRHVLPHSGPVIAAGDFNATTDHAQFRRLLAHGYADAAQQSGAGYLPTYPNDRWYGPLIGIDHVLLRGGVGAADVRTLGVRGSDHRALLARLRY